MNRCDSWWNSGIFEFQKFRYYENLNFLQDEEDAICWYCLHVLHCISNLLFSRFAISLQNISTDCFVALYLSIVALCYCAIWMYIKFVACKKYFYGKNSTNGQLHSFKNRQNTKKKKEIKIRILKNANYYKSKGVI